MKVIDRTIGVAHFLFDSVPSGLPVVPPRPRQTNPWLKDDKPVLVKFRTGRDIRQDVRQSLEALGPLTSIIKRGDKVMVKPNFNSEDPPPASTDLPFLEAVIEILLDLGARVTIGESSGGVWRPTRRVFENLHLFDFARKLGVDLISFEEPGREWVRVSINGDYLPSVVMPRSAYESDRLVYLPCLKVHRLAHYSGALKLAFGFVHPGERRGFHIKMREEKLAEVNLCWQPDLILLDGRRAFVTGGPNQGQVVAPELLLASADLVAIDVEAVKTLLSYHARNNLLSDPWQELQISTAIRYGLGTPHHDYALITPNR